MKFKKIIVIIFLLCILTLTSSCFPSYEEIWGNPELQAVGINSMLGVYCYEENLVKMLEEDDFGRTLFAYVAKSIFADTQHNYQISIVISQKTTEKNSYFYPDVNYITYELADEDIYYSPEGIPTEIIEKYFTSEQIEALKQRNDWNKTLNEGNFFEVKIYDVKPSRISYDKMESELQKVSNLKPGKLFIINNRGDEVYCARDKIFDDILQEDVWKYYLVIFDKDGNIYEDGIEEIIDIWDYKEQLMAFKARFNWDG